MNGDNVDNVDHYGSAAPQIPVGPSLGINNQQQKQKQKQKQQAEPFSRKRKLASVLADPFARLAAAKSSGGGDSQSGRGSQAGWTYCPLCFPLSKKMFARCVLSCSASS
jgi:hypothetical protein